MPDISPCSVVILILIWIFLFHGLIQPSSSRVYVKTGVLENGIPFEEEDIVHTDRETGAQMLQKVVRMMVNVHVHHDKPQDHMDNPEPMLMGEPPVLEQEHEPLINPEVELSLEQINELLFNTFHNLDTNLPDNADVANLKILVSKLESLATGCHDANDVPRKAESSSESSDEEQAPQESKEAPEVDLKKESEEKKASDSSSSDDHQSQESKDTSEIPLKKEQASSGEEDDDSKQANSGEVIDIIGEPKKETPEHGTEDNQQQENDIDFLKDAALELMGSKQEELHEESTNDTSSDHSVVTEPEKTEETESKKNDGDTADTDNSSSAEINDGDKASADTPDESAPALSSDAPKDEKSGESKADVEEVHVDKVEDGGQKSNESAEITETNKDSAEKSHETDDVKTEEEEEKRLEEELDELKAHQAQNDDSKEKEEIENIENDLKNFEHEHHEANAEGNNAR